MKRKLLSLILSLAMASSLLPSTVLATGSADPSHQHSPIQLSGAAPTCTEPGLTDGSYCLDCGTFLVEQKIIPAVGHTPVTVPAIAATCTEPGVTAGSHCSVCSLPLTPQTIIEAKGHVPVTDPAVAATCTTSGLTAGSHCSVCGVVLKTQEATPLLDHDFSNTSLSTCANCSAPNPNSSPDPAPDHKHTPMTLPAVAATCTTTGLTAGSTCLECGETLLAQTVIAKLPHDFRDKTVPTCANCPALNPDYSGSDTVLPFSDIPAGSWYEPAVVYVYTNGIMNGTGEGLFSPSVSASRAMLIVMLARLEGVDTSGGATWYEKAINWAITSGVSDGTNPNGNITREQLVTMLWRFSGEPAASGSLTSFVDGSKVSPWATDAMIWATQKGIISGMGNNDLVPQGNATRAQIAQIFMNYQTK